MPRSIWTHSEGFRQEVGFCGRHRCFWEMNLFDKRSNTTDWLLWVIFSSPLKSSPFTKQKWSQKVYMWYEEIKWTEVLILDRIKLETTMPLKKYLRNRAFPNRCMDYTGMQGSSIIFRPAGSQCGFSPDGKRDGGFFEHDLCSASWITSLSWRWFRISVPSSGATRICFGWNVAAIFFEVHCFHGFWPPVHNWFYFAAAPTPWIIMLEWQSIVSSLVHFGASSLC